MKINMINFSPNFGNSKPVYVFNKQEEKFERFSSITQAQRVFDAPSDKFERSFINASEIETQDKSGNFIIDFEKMKPLFQRRNRNTIYEIKPDGQIRRFVNLSEASKGVNIDSARIANCVKNKNKICEGRTFVKGNEIEYLDKDGKVCVDESKLQKIIKRVFDNPYLDDKKICMINLKTGECFEFASMSDASKELGINSSCISIARSCAKVTNGYIVPYMNEVLSVNEDGAMFLDPIKIKKFRKEFLK